jgi:hypothetical protein
VKSIIMALPLGGKGPRSLTCVECDSFRGEKVMGGDLSRDLPKTWVFVMRATGC